MKLHPKDWHKDHKQELVLLTEGPHKGKWICTECKGKWVRWASAKEIKREDNDKV